MIDSVRMTEVCEIEISPSLEMTFFSCHSVNAKHLVLDLFCKENGSETKHLSLVFRKANRA